MAGCCQPKDQHIAEAKRLFQKRHPNGIDVEFDNNTFMKVSLRE